MPEAQEPRMETCEECGLPMVECSAAAIARKEAERWLRDEGYSGLEARKRAAELVPSTRSAVVIGDMAGMLYQEAGQLDDIGRADGIRQAADRLQRLEREVAELREKGAAVGSALDDWIKLVGCSSLGAGSEFWTRSPTHREVQAAMRANNALADVLSTPATEAPHP